MNNSLTRKILLLTIISTFCIMMFSMSFAAWWGEPGYQWAVRNNLTTLKSRNQLAQEVELDDLYSTILRYLSMKKITSKAGAVHHEDKMEGMDNVAVGLFDIINSYNSRESLTMQQYYIVENYVTKGYETLEKYRTYSLTLTREDLKNIDSYLKLSKYKAATLVDNRPDREYALSRVGYVKNSKIILYNILPYAEKITRREFLLLMHDLISSNSLDGDQVIQAFVNTEVLQGYDPEVLQLELDKLLNYQEMYSFLYRFEIFDFESNAILNTSAS